MTAAEQVTPALAEHGEGPVWDVRDGRLRFVDMLAGDLLEFDPGTGRTPRRHLSRVLAAIRPRRTGGFVLAVERGFALLDGGGTEVTPVAEPVTDPGVRMNEGGCDPQGRFYAGSMAYDESPGRGTLYRLGPDRTVHRVLDGVSVSNGLGFSPDGRTMYYVDSPTGRVDAFDPDPDTGELTGRRTVADVGTDGGVPDGLAVDAEGGLWVAVNGGSAVRRYTPDGRLDAVVEVPARQVTACTFGGPDLADLYVTTSRLGLGDGAEPAAGALFRTRPGVRGLPALDYAG